MRIYQIRLYFMAVIYIYNVVTGLMMERIISPRDGAIHISKVYRAPWIFRGCLINHSQYKPAMYEKYEAAK